MAGRQGSKGQGGYDTRFAQCRTRTIYGHQWDDYIPGPGEFEKPPFGVRVTMQCLRCDAIKHRLIARDTLQVLTAWSYYHPEGYKPEEPMDNADYARIALREYEARAKAK